MGPDVQRVLRCHGHRARLTLTPTTSPTSMASPAMTACVRCWPRAGSSCPRASPATRRPRETVCGLGNRKNEVFSQVLASDGVEPYPGSVRADGRPGGAGRRDGGRVELEECPRSAWLRPGSPHRFEVVVDGEVARRAGPEGQAVGRDLHVRSDAAGRAASRERLSSRMRCRASPLVATVASGSSSESTAAPDVTLWSSRAPTSSSRTSPSW